MLIIPAVEGLEVERNDGNLALTVRAVMVGREGENSDLVFGLGMRGRIGSDLFRFGLVQISDVQIPHLYSDLIRVCRRVVAETVECWG